jgi:hypothetical protein
MAKRPAAKGANSMNAKSAAVLLSGLLAACAPTQPPEAAAPPAPSPPPAEAAAPPPTTEPAAPPVDHVVNIRRAGCQDLLKLSPDDRSAASMFYIGYEASRFGSSTINVGGIPSIAAQAFTYCQEHPERTAAQAFAEAYSRRRR